MKRRVVLDAHWDDVVTESCANCRWSRPSPGQAPMVEVMVSDDPVTDILRAEGERRYSLPTPKIETWADFIEWQMREGEAYARFYERLRFAQVDEYIADMYRAHRTTFMEEGAGI